MLLKGLNQVFGHRKITGVGMVVKFKIHMFGINRFHYESGYMFPARRSSSEPPTTLLAILEVSPFNE